MKGKILNDEGFTLIEIIVVLVILAILMSMAMPSVFGYTRKGQRTAAIAECRSSVNAAISSLSDKYVLTGNRIPDADTKSETKNLSQVDGEIEKIEGNKNYIVSYLRYKYSDTITAIYKEGEFYIDDGTDPGTGGGFSDDTNNSGGGSEGGGGGGESGGGGSEGGGSEGGESGGGGSEGGGESGGGENPGGEGGDNKPDDGNLPSTDGITIIDSSGTDHNFGDPNNLWEFLKADSQIQGEAGTTHVDVGTIYEDSSGVFVCVNRQWTGILDSDLLLADYSKEVNDSLSWGYAMVQITSDTKVYTQKDMDELNGKEIYIKTGDIKYVDGEYYVWNSNSQNIYNPWSWGYWTKINM